MDGVALSTSGGILIEGQFKHRTPETAPLVSDISWRSGVSFYKTLLKDGDDYLTVRDYIWRWDADWFWCTQIFPGLGWRLVRFLCGPHLLRSDMYKVFNDKFTRMLPKFLLRNQELVIQDIEVPVQKSAEWWGTSTLDGGTGLVWDVVLLGTHSCAIGSFLAMTGDGEDLDHCSQLSSHHSHRDIFSLCIDEV